MASSRATTTTLWFASVRVVPGHRLVLHSYGSSTYAALEQVVSASGQIGTAQAAPAPSDTVEPQISYLFTGTACDNAGSCVTGGEYENTSTIDFPYEVSEQAPLAVSTTSLPAGSQHTPYTTTLAATGAWGVYTWSVSSGCLPAGLSLNAQTGVISGTPSAAGTSTFTVQATGTGTPVPTATQSLSVTIAAVPPVIQILGHTGLVKSNRLGVKLGCSKWNCAGSVKVQTTEVVTIRHGKKRVRKHRTVVIGSARYSVAVGTTKVLNIVLNSAGRKALVKAKTHHLRVTITATVNGGNQAARSERIWTATKKRHKK